LRDVRLRRKSLRAQRRHPTTPLAQVCCSGDR
jgi:hypothetical protein